MEEKLAAPVEVLKLSLQGSEDGQLGQAEGPSPRETWVSLDRDNFSRLLPMG